MRLGVGKLEQKHCRFLDDSNSAKQKKICQQDENNLCNAAAASALFMVVQGDTCLATRAAAAVQSG